MKERREPRGRRGKITTGGKIEWRKKWLESKEKQEAVDEFMDALGQVVLGRYQRAASGSRSRCRGLEKGKVNLQFNITVAPLKLQCSVSRQSGHEIQLFEIQGGYEKFGCTLLGKDNQN